MPELPLAGGALREARSDIGGFKKFILRGNVVDLAVGVVIGAAFGNVVQSIVKDIIQPLIGAFGGPNPAGLTVTIGGIQFPFGDLISAIISFLLIALVVYFVVVLPTNRLTEWYPINTEENEEGYVPVPYLSRTEPKDRPAAPTGEPK